MAYNLRYEGYHTGFYDNNEYKLLIYERDYDDSEGSEKIEFGSFPSPFREKIRASEEDIGENILGKEIEFELYPPPSDLNKFDHIFESQYKDFYVEITKNSLLYFAGWLLPQNLKKDFVTSPNSITFSASDGLSELKEIPYVESDKTKYVADYVSIKDAIGYALEKVGIDLDIEIAVNTYETNAIPADSNNRPEKCPFSNIYISMKRFLKGEGGGWRPPAYSDYVWESGRRGRHWNWGGDSPASRGDRSEEGSERRRKPSGSPVISDKSPSDIDEVDDCYTVIERILQPFNAILRQINGRWVIENPLEMDSQSFFFDGTNPYNEQTGSPQSNDNIVVLDNEDDFEPFGSLTKLSPKKRIYTELMQRRLGDRVTEIDSWDQDKSKPEWEMPDDLNYFFWEFDNSQNTINSSSDDELDITVNPANSNTGYDAVIVSDFVDLESYLPDDFDPEEHTVYIKVRLQLKLKSIDTDKTTPPTIGLLVQHPSDKSQEDIHVQDVGDAVKNSEAGWRWPKKDYLFFWDEFTYFTSPNNEQFLVTKKPWTAEANKKHRIMIVFKLNDFDSADIVFKGRPDIRVEYANISDSSRDKRFSKDADVPGIDGGSVSLSFGDGHFSSDISSMTYIDEDTGTQLPTASWNRWERDDEISIIWLYLQQQLNQFRDYRNVVQINKYDRDDIITPRSIIQIDNKVYRILGWSKEYGNSYVKMRLVQIYPSYLYGDVGNPVTEYTLDSVDGANQEMQYPEHTALDVQNVNGKIASSVRQEAEDGAANKSYTGQNVDDWDDYPSLSGTDKRLGIRINKDDNYLIIGLLNADDTSNEVTYEIEIEVSGAEFTDSWTSDKTGDWSGTGDTIELESDNKVATISGSHSSNNDCYTLEVSRDLRTTQKDVVFKLKVKKYDDNNINTWNISFGDRPFGQNLDIPLISYFSAIDSNEIDVLRTTNAPAEANADKTDSALSRIDDITIGTGEGNDVFIHFDDGEAATHDIKWDVAEERFEINESLYVDIDI
ncbi:MAG: hypothetical protein ACOC40_02960, partial [Thermoplasmatota archaeon]